MTKKAAKWEYDADGNIIVDGYTIHELTLGDMRSIQMDGVDKGTIQYLMAARCVVKPDGSFISEDELMKIGARRGTRILQAVAEMNTAPGDDEGEG